MYFAIRNWVAATGLSREDLSDEHAWQLSQEFRLASNFSGPFNFSVGGNYLHYETEENYYVFINALYAVHSVDEWQSIRSRRYPMFQVSPTIINACKRCRSNGQVDGYQNPNPIVGGGEPTTALHLYRSESDHEPQQ